MQSEKVWRVIATVLCAAVPLSFYVVGDLADAFPGVLTVQKDDTGPMQGPPARGEDYEHAGTTPLPPTTDEDQPPIDPAELAARMDLHAEDPVVDGNLAFSVVDADSGEVLAARDADTARIPASTMKLLTASAALRTLGPDATLTTSAVVKDNTLTLVGTGDMMLTDEKLDTLADRAVENLDGQGGEPIRVELDTTALPGGENPAWGDNGTAGGWVAPTAALALDEGRLDDDEFGRKSTDPAQDVAEAFVRKLEDRDVEVAGDIESGSAPEDGRSAEVESPPISDIVQHTLLTSDNTTAELLAHLVAAHQGRDATPEQAANAVSEEVAAMAAELGVPAADIDAVEVHDGSGLSTANRIPPALLAAVLGEVSSGQAPELAPLLYDVPVGALSGTLAGRFDDPDVAPAKGAVRGKTGYLGGTAALAGVTVLPDGRTVAFDIVVHDFDGEESDEARHAVDAVAAELVRAP